MKAKLASTLGNYRKKYENVYKFILGHTIRHRVKKQNNLKEYPFAYETSEKRVPS